MIHASAYAPFGVAPQRADATGEADDADQHDPSGAEDVGEPAAKGESGGKRQDVAVDDPLDAAAAQVEFLLDIRAGDRRRWSGR